MNMLEGVDSKSSSDYSYTFFVRSVTCSGCTNAIQDALERLGPNAFIKEVSTDHVNKTVTVTTNWIVDPKMIMKIIRDVGHDPVEPNEDKCPFFNPADEGESDWRIINCSEEDLSAILCKQSWCRDYNYDEFEQRMRICFSQDEVEIEKKIKETFLKYNIFKINDNYCEYHFKIHGLTKENKSEIIKVLNENACINDPDSINLEIKEVSLRANIEFGELKRFIEKLNASFKKNALFCTIEYDGSEKHQQIVETTAETYFYRARYNLIYGFIVFFAKFYMGSSLTLKGQMIGLSVGLVTLGVMWKTGEEFYRQAWTDFIKNRASSMYTLISLGTASAWIYSMMLVLLPGFSMGGTLQYQFLPISMILMIINGGQGIRRKVKEKSDQILEQDIKAHRDLQPKKAYRVKPEVKDLVDLQKQLNFIECPENFKKIRHQYINENDIFLVKPGKRFPTDGVIISNIPTMVDEYVFCGNHKKIEKTQYMAVYGGSRNVGGPVLIQARCQSRRSRIAAILKILEESKFLQPSISPLIDTISKIFVPTVIMIAVISFLVWLTLSAIPHMAWISAMSVLLCACPCAMGLSIISDSIGISEMFKRKIIVRNPGAIKTLAEVNVIVFDKTGTLTYPQVKSGEIKICDNQFSEEVIISAIGELEKASNKNKHPIAQALIQYSRQRSPLKVGNIAVLASEIKNDPQGISGKVKIGEEIQDFTVGSYHYVVGEMGCDIALISGIVENKEEQFNDKTIVYIARDKKCIGIVTLEQELRQGAAETVKKLKELKMEVHLLTGDQDKPARAIAEKLGIEIIESNKTEEEKGRYISGLKKDGKIVAMVGDGVNDTLAFRQAHIKIAPGSWTELSENCHLAMQELNVDEAIIIARETINNVWQNLGWTLLYNCVALIFATGALYFVCGFFLTPIIASMLMSSSSIGVIINSNRLRFEINDKIKIHKKEMDEPGTLLEKMLSLRSFLGTILMLMYISVDPTEVKEDDHEKTGESPISSEQGKSLIFTVQKELDGKFDMFSNSYVSLSPGIQVIKNA